MPIKIVSPHRFAERILLFGGSGVGKTNTALDIISNVAYGDMYVLDSDYSGAYDRALATDFVDIADRVDVRTPDQEWDSWIKELTDVTGTANPDHDWIVVDPVHSSYDWVQEWVLEQVHGGDLARMLMDLKKTYPDPKDYARARSDLMNWELVKKEYSKLWRTISRWGGNLILIAEAKPVNQREKDDETKMLFGPLGFMPAGQASLKHVCSTNLFLDHPSRGRWRITTIKDRNREEVDKMVVDSFAEDYLVEIGGWEKQLIKDGDEQPAKAPVKKAPAKKAPAKKVAAAKKAAPKKITLDDVEATEDTAEGED